MKSALIVLFNQDFSRSIPKLESLYRHRFSEVLYLVPDHHSALDRFYRGGALARAAAYPLDCVVSRLRRQAGKRNPGALENSPGSLDDGRLIRVCGHQFYFYHFLVQAANALRKLDVDWIWVLGDDALLNPRIDERTIHGFLGLNSDTDSVLCRPVIGSDKWIERIAGSVASAERDLADSLVDPPQIVAIEAEPGAERNRSVPVACADFFGFRRDRLEAFLRSARACFARKLYVEIAVPNILLSVCRSTFFLTGFDWRRIEADGWRPLVADLLASSSAAFAHPVKLSQIPAEEIPALLQPVKHETFTAHASDHRSR